MQFLNRLPAADLLPVILATIFAVTVLAVVAAWLYRPLIVLIESWKRGIPLADAKEAIHADHSLLPDGFRLRKKTIRGITGGCMIVGCFCVFIHFADQQTQAEWSKTTSDFAAAIDSVDRLTLLFDKRKAEHANADAAAHDDVLAIIHRLARNHEVLITQSSKLDAPSPSHGYVTAKVLHYGRRSENGNVLPYVERVMIQIKSTTDDRLLWTEEWYLPTMKSRARNL
jgi:hypothetical protein